MNLVLNTQKNKKKLTLLSPTIIIPLHVNSSHWTSIIRKRIDERIIFFYCDDLNNKSQESDIRRLYNYSNTSPIFHPPNSQWIVCSSYTYLPHSNECGPRALLASAIIALHPNPTQNSLLPAMHPNIAQISRWWIAKCILIATVRFADIIPLCSGNRP